MTERASAPPSATTLSRQRRSTILPPSQLALRAAGLDGVVCTMEEYLAAVVDVRQGAFMKDVSVIGERLTTMIGDLLVMTLPVEAP